MIDLPIPPIELRELVGLIDPAGYENHGRVPCFEEMGVPESNYRSFLDFGCGCGRSARRLALQLPKPENYVGIDLHRGMVSWCQRELQPLVDGFRFEHHNVFSPCLNPDRTLPWAAPFPVEDRSISLIEATSVFTHLIEGQAEHYLDEVARVLTDDGMLMATFFMFDKQMAPFLQDNQNALYCNPLDPTNAVIYDRDWLRGAVAERGMSIVRAVAPSVRGFHTWIGIARKEAGMAEIELPPDLAPAVRSPPPLLRVGAEHFGLEDGRFTDPVSLSIRADLPAPDPLAIELRHAKEYIASLERELGRNQPS
jgi:SAM-dependent methyltransferase